MPKREKIIYDFGSNNGDDIPYYAKKSDRVIAVEANPVLADQIRLRFPELIRECKLVVENCVLTIGQEDVAVFYVHKNNHVLSQFPTPDPNELSEFDAIQLPAKNVLELIKKHGDPFYVKVDLENYDQTVLKELFLNGIRPDFISGESHSIEVFTLMVALGNYNSFNMVEGSTIETVYRNHPIMTKAGNELYSFRDHSAGPFGEDIKGEWMTADNFFRLLAFKGLGWRDIHATNTIIPNAEAKVHLSSFLHREARLQAGDALRSRTPSLYQALQKIRRRPMRP